MAFMRSRGSKIVLAGAGFLLVSAAVGAVAFYLAFLRDLPDLHGVSDYQPPLASFARPGFLYLWAPGAR